MSKEPFLQYRKRLMDPISRSFCAAKWYNATIWLGSGRTASCHHPPMHQVDQNQLLKDPSFLHNTDKKKHARSEMLKGDRPSECDYCWRIEDLGEESISDRVYKTEIYTDDDINLLVEHGATRNVNLKTLEIAFDRTCNFACSYCNSSFSTTWGQDIVRNGHYQNLVSDGAKAYQQDGKWADPYEDSQENPYLRAFWKWWPDLKKSLQELRVTGGEPTLSRSFWRLVETLSEDYPSQMRFSVNTNLGCKKELIDRLIKLSHSLEQFDIYTSCEAVGAQAEYIRDGMNYEFFCKNVERILSESNVRVLHIMMTINSLCLFSLDDFLGQVISWKKKHGPSKIMVSANILRFPSFMSPFAIPENILKERREHLLKWFQREGKYLSTWEGNSISRFIDYLRHQSEPHRRTSSRDSLHLDFKSFYTQYDKRRNKDFRKTFPPSIVKWFDEIEDINLSSLTQEDIERDAKKRGWVLNPEDENPG